MSILPMCKTAQEGVSGSVVDLNDVSHVFATAVPGQGTTLREQTWNALNAMVDILDQFEAADSILHLTVFLADGNQTAACRQIVREFFGATMPATSYVPQPPCSGSLVAVEAMALGRGREKVEIRRISDQVLEVREAGLRWIFADQAVPLTSATGVYEKTICSYQHLRRLLPEGGARLDQVLRTWLYLGGIVNDDGPIQRYKELNRARTDVYEGVPFLAERLPEGYTGPAFPASTGIGTNGRGISVSALALVTDHDDVVAVPLENPRQTSAFAYSTTYSPRSPKFSRGLAVVQGKETTLFISGTASIVHSETQHRGDVVAQTNETLANIRALIAEENLARHGLPGRGTTLDGLAVARVYIKHPEDYAIVREVCQRCLPCVPLTFVVADVCRPDLLVEIEGMAFSRRTERAGPAEPTVSRRANQCCSGICAQSNPVPAPLCPDGCPERYYCPYAVLR